MKDFLYCLIFPHPSNNHRAHFLQPKALMLVIFLLVFGGMFFSSNLNPLGPRLRAFADVSVQELIKLTNEKRTEEGLNVLILNSMLSEAAQEKAEDMFEKNYWAHNSPDGITPWVFIKGTGYEYVYAGENLARGFKDSKDVVNAWMASQSHRENLLSPKFREVGFAVKTGTLNGEETILVVQEFGSKSVLSADTENSPPVNKENIPNELNLSGSTQSIPKISYSSEVVMLIIIGIIVLFIIDLIYIKRKNIVRFAGHNADHIFFLGTVVILIIILNSGSIL